MVYYYCMNNYHWTPSQYLAMTKREKALVIAGIELRLEQEEKEKKEAERKAKRN